MSSQIVGCSPVGLFTIFSKMLICYMQTFLTLPETSSRSCFSRLFLDSISVSLKTGRIRYHFLFD